MKVLWIGAIILVALVIMIIYLGETVVKTGPKTLSNITELYSSFTQYMKMNVNYRLLAIDCKPEEYYYNESICFICDEFDACFGYGWVNRGAEGYLMNPKDNGYLIGDYTIVDETSLNSLGLSKALGCGVEGEITECVDGVTLRFEGEKSIFSFPENVNKTKKIEDVFESMVLDCTFTTYNTTNVIGFSCEVISGLIRENEVII